jgi:uncharacterized protein YdiU (UPF0061 family)
MTVLAAPATLETLALSDGYASLGPDFVERREPEPVAEPYLIAFNPDAAALIDLAPEQSTRPEFLRLAAGCARFARVEPFAAVYAGHQFGSFVPQLGDGRAITLAEVRTAAGDPFEWQVKGAGMTAYSRFGDGRAVRRSTIREYLCSEAMAALGVPTTRALAIAGSDEAVYRETAETAAVLTRLAPSHLRFGTFEYFHYRGNTAAVKTLADYALARFFPHLASVTDDAARYAALLREIVERTATLIARWQAVGFAHGVMNTDNMSILGLTLDYGPYGFLDAYDPGFICNHTDAGGRYAFEQQPAIGLWNCRALAAALSSLVPDAAAQEALDAYKPAFAAHFTSSLYEKFGLTTARAGDAEFFTEAFGRLARGAVDYTNFFRALSCVASDGAASAAGQLPNAAETRFLELFADAEDGRTMLAAYRLRLQAETRPDAERQSAMLAVNPKYVLRNYLAEQTIRAARERDYTELARLHDVLRRPFDDRPGFEAYAAAPPDWARTLSVSCSS